jgi:hypothetical protein
MPLSAKGKSLLSKFAQEYGSKKGKSVFYAKENADPKFARVVRGKKKA